MIEISHQLHDDWDATYRHCSPTWLYRHFGLRGELLYVGISNQITQRTFNHRAKRWFCFSAYLFIEIFPERRLAEIAENYAIEADDPIYNIKRKPTCMVGVGVCPGFFDRTKGILMGSCRQWADPREYDLPNIDRPDVFSCDPAPIRPRFADDHPHYDPKALRKAGRVVSKHAAQHERELKRTIMAASCEDQCG